MLAKSQRQFTKLSGDEGAFSPVPSSVSHTPIVGRNLSSSTLSLKDGSPLMHGSSFAPGFVPVPSSTSSSGSSSVPVSEDTIPLVISTQSAGPAYTLPGSISSPITPSKLVATSGSFSAANSPSDHSSPVSTGNNSSGSGSGSSGASAIRLKYSMRRASVGSVGNSNQSSSSSGGQSRPTSVTKSSLQPQYPTQYATTNTHVSSLSGSLNSATVDSLAPISIRSPHANSDTFSSAGNLKMKFATTSSQGNVATTTQGSVPLPQRPIGAISPDSSVGRPAENSIIPLESGEPYAGNTYQLNSGLQQLPEGNAESDDEAIIVNVKQSSANSPLLSNVYNAFAPTTGTRISTVAEMTEPSSLSGSSPTSGGSQESLKKEAKPAEIKRKKMTKFKSQRFRVLHHLRPQLRRRFTLVRITATARRISQLSILLEVVWSLFNRHHLLLPVSVQTLYYTNYLPDLAIVYLSACRFTRKSKLKFTTLKEKGLNVLLPLEAQTTFSVVGTFTVFRTFWFSSFF